MSNRLRTVRLNLVHSLGFVPAVVVAFFAILGLFLVELDRRIGITDLTYVFAGDGSAARTVLSIIAGSLITVAGLTFSITMVVLQLASSQFSPRILRTFFGDRLTQITIGTYVGIFVYSIFVLRAVGGDGSAEYVPRISITVASLLGVGAVCLLIAFLHHVSTMVQVSGVTAKLARTTLRKVEMLYPGSDDPPEEPIDHQRELAAWRSNSPAPGAVLPARPGYLQRVSIDELVTVLDGTATRAAVMVTPGDFVSVESPLVLVWPASAAAECRRALLATVSVTSERDLDQDLDFGLRQLTDIALKALSPGINDPMTAITCIGYLRAVLVRLGECRDLPPLLHGSGGLPVLVRRRGFEEYLDCIVQINRYVAGDVWVAGELMQLLTSCARQVRSASTLGTAATNSRVTALRAVADAVTERTEAELVTTLDRQRLRQWVSEFELAAG